MYEPELQQIPEAEPGEGQETVWSWIIGIIAAGLILIGSACLAEDKSGKYIIIHEATPPAASQPDLLLYGVKLRCGPRGKAHLGCGVILHDGTVLTAAHCIQGTGPIVVDAEGRNEATVTRFDASADLALLTVKWIKPRNGAKIASEQPGTSVEVWACGRDRNGQITLEPFKTQASSNGRLRLVPAFISGSSGGGIFNRKRELIGIICENDVSDEPYIAQAADLITIRKFLGLQPLAEGHWVAVMYSTRSCGWCRANDTLMRSRQVLPFRYREVMGHETSDNDPDGSRDFPEFIRKHAKVYGWPVWHVERATDGAVVSGYKTPEEIVRLHQGE